MAEPPSGVTDCASPMRVLMDSFTSTVNFNHNDHIVNRARRPTVVWAPDKSERAGLSICPLYLAIYAPLRFRCSYTQRHR